MKHITVKLTEDQYYYLLTVLNNDLGLMIEHKEDAAFNKRLQTTLVRAKVKVT